MAPSGPTSWYSRHVLSPALGGGLDLVKGRDITSKIRSQED